MTYHIVVGLPDGRTAYVDADNPIAPAMHRVNNAIMAAESKRHIGYPGNPKDYAIIAEWLDANEALSQSCRVGLWPGVTCIHDTDPRKRAVVLPSSTEGKGKPAMPGEIYNAAETRRMLVSRYRYTSEQADFIVRYTAEDREHPSKQWKTRSGFITLRYRNGKFGLEDSREKSRKPLAIRPKPRYTPEGKGLPRNSVPERKAPTMATPRGRRAAPAPAPAPEPESNGTVDFQKYLDKDLSPTMADYVTWFEDNVAPLEDVPIDKLFALGSSLYGHFQKSDFNISRREERAAARDRAAAPEPEPAPAKRRGRPAKAAEPEPEPEPAPRRRGRPPRGAAAAPAPAPAAPARRGRGRATAAAGAEAPY